MSLGGGSSTDMMSGADALLWTIGRDPVLRPTVVAILTLDRAPDFAKVRARTERLTEIVPRLRSRVTAAPWWRVRPRFEVDSRFDLDAHLSRVVLPKPGTFRDVLDIAQLMATRAFDPVLPLWEAVIVEGVANGRTTDGASLILKVHHCVVDGVGGLSVLMNLLDTVRRPRSRPQAPESPNRVPDGGTVNSGAATRSILQSAVNQASHPRQSIEQVAATVSSAARLLAPAGRPISRLMTERSFRRDLEVLDVSQQGLRQAATAAGVTLNDAFVAAVARGLRRYHEIHGVSIESLRALMPINVRADQHAMASNHFVPARFVVPTGGDAATCMAEVSEVTGSWKHSPALDLSDLMAAGLSMLPPQAVSVMWGSMLKGDDFCVTNIPGPPFDTYLAGSRVEQMYAFAPPSGAALNVSLVTYAGQACLGVTADSAAIPDSAKLASCLADGVDEVLKAALQGGKSTTARGLGPSALDAASRSCDG
jgi:diacylglycerol O-acyltransferase